ncbi:hypothetical protein NEIFLAOT_01766 [Neisseria flavescens NRL30031/H210]|uniref:Uncharacterized protein n=1 Tax=Neisseria flavescens NRL30031/H210 TaxID=546264 RepID=C0EP76_NEIFL|nr:hypothetical protein NEIFLAOT_01766 [Neisseria flavescens NRL30031/H210]
MISFQSKISVNKTNIAETAMFAAIKMVVAVIMVSIWFFWAVLV